MIPQDIDYSQFVAKLAKSGTVIANDLNNDTNKKLTSILNMTMRLGIVAGKLLDECVDFAQLEDDYTPDSAHAVHMGIGIFGEVGELVDAIKKAAVYNKPMDNENVMEELGDIEFYTVGLSQSPRLFNYLPQFTEILGAIHSLIDTNRKTIREGNISKLYKRYEGAVYSDQAAQDRADKAE